MELHSMSREAHLVEQLLDFHLVTELTVHLEWMVGWEIWETMDQLRHYTVSTDSQCSPMEQMPTYSWKINMPLSRGPTNPDILIFSIRGIFVHGKPFKQAASHFWEHQLYLNETLHVEVVFCLFFGSLSVTFYSNTSHTSVNWSSEVSLTAWQEFSFWKQ